MSENHTDPHGHDSGIRPYLTIILTAVVIGVGLAVYMVGYRAEILAILTQSPT